MHMCTGIFVCVDKDVCMHMFTGIFVCVDKDGNTPCS